MGRRVTKLKPILSEEDKKIVGSIIKKKKKLGKVNVYFNKKVGDKTKYIQGQFYSKKNKEMIYYRSSYELKCFLDLEKNGEVVSYVSEGLSIPYTDSNRQRRTYVPDLLVLFKDGVS